MKEQIIRNAGTIRNVVGMKGSVVLFGVKEQQIKQGKECKEPEAEEKYLHYCVTRIRQ